MQIRRFFTASPDRGERRGAKAMPQAQVDAAVRAQAPPPGQSVQELRRSRA